MAFRNVERYKIIAHTVMFFSYFLGIGFWIAADVTEIGTISFEQNLRKQILSSGLNISACKLIQLKGMITYAYLIVFKIYNCF